MRSIESPETRRLRGHPGHRDAAADLLVLYSDPAIAEWLWPGSLGGPRNRAQVERILLDDERCWRKDGFGPWLFFGADERIAGRAGLRREGDEAELLYAVHPALWGQGYAPEMARIALDAAFGPLGLESVIALVRPENVRSRAVVDRLGFTREAEIMHAGLPHVRLRLRATSAGTP